MIQIDGTNIYGINRYELKRKDGSIELKYLVKYKDRLKRGFNSPYEAYVFLQNLKNGTIKMPEKYSKMTYEEVNKSYTVASAIEYYLNYYKNTDVDYGTYDKAKYYFKEVVLPNVDGNMPLKNFSNLDALEFRNKLGKSIKKKPRREGEEPATYATRTKNDILQIFKEFLLFAIDNLDADPRITKNVKKFEKTHEDKIDARAKEESLWTTDEYVKFLKKIKELYGEYSPTYGVYLIIGHKGTRLGETLALKFKDIKEGEQCWLEIDESVTRKTEDGGYKFNKPKSEKSDRNIVIGEEIKNYLLEYKAREMRHIDYSDDWLIFHRQGQPNKPIAERTLNNHKAEALKAIGLRWNTNHQMRHMFNTAMKDGGVNAFDRGTVLGNDGETNREIYTHASPETIKKVLEIEKSMTNKSIKERSDNENDSKETNNED